tara:strand:+ start:324 stop:602 length:279 start_codon:yes stop_codon:yes gene_type:complete
MSKLSKLQMLKNGGMRYNNVRIENTPSPTMSEMVQITKGPKYTKSLWGKKFVNIIKASYAIDIIQTENKITKGYVDPSCVVSIDNGKIVVIK